MKSRLSDRRSSTIVDVHSNRSVPSYRQMRIGIVFRASNITPYYFGASRGTSHGSIRASRSLGRHELGERKSGGPERPNCRGRLRSDRELQPGAHSGLGPHRLAEGHQRPRDAGHRLEEGLGIALRPPRDHERAPNRPVRRLQQLVRGLRVLGFQVLRDRQCRPSQRRAEKMDRAGPPVTKDLPSFPAASFKAKEPDETVRVYLPYVREAYRQSGKVLVDVRSPKEFTGEILAPPEYPTEHAQRGGHIPGAKNIPWAQAVNEDGTFKPVEQLKALYEPKGVTSDKEVIAYCRIGERSSHTWFVLKYLLGFPHVTNYDGSWTGWGNLVRTPIEK